MSWALEARDIDKAFAGVPVLRGVSLRIASGEVHALLGQNGAGKSTLMKILLGLHAPDRGEILCQGRPVRLRHPQDARRLGLAMIHQELMSFPDLTVAENIFMGQEPASRFWGWIDGRRMRQEAARLLDRLGVKIDPAQRLGELSVAELQVVEIAKALAHRAEVLAMDEPTSALSLREVEALFARIEELRRDGVAIVYISHKLDEVFRLANTVTVLRDGRFQASGPIGEFDEPRLIRLMAGEPSTERPIPHPAAPGEVVLAARGLTQTGRFQDIDLELRRGEILGLTGLMGAGRTELAHALYGLTRPNAGELSVGDRPARISSPADALRAGIGWLSEDRKEQGLVLGMSLGHNVTLAGLARCCRWEWIDRRQEADAVAQQMRALGVKASHPDQTVRHLSGGNQQKVALAKALFPEPTILILDEPTRGIDVAAKAEIYGLIKALAGAGKAILLISSELPEILALSDRILVMRQGRLAAELPGKQTTAAEILRHAMPVAAEHPSPSGGRSDGPKAGGTERAAKRGTGTT